KNFLLSISFTRKNPAVNFFNDSKNSISDELKTS
ncbi:unnamed protein product, partial [marine sediment metagenome]